MMLKIGMNFISEVVGSEARLEAQETLHTSVSDRRCVCSRKNDRNATVSDKKCCVLSAMSTKCASDLLAHRLCILINIKKIYFIIIYEQVTYSI
jgi:hypothetical protein